MTIRVATSLLPFRHGTFQAPFVNQLIGMHVRDIMTVEVHTCTAVSTTPELMKMMTEHRIRHVPVVDKDGILISIVSIGDIVKSRVGEMESENQALRDYVTTG